MVKNKGHDNLRHVKPGQVLNPNGRPKGSRNRSTIVREIIEAVLDGEHLVVDAMTKSIAEKAVSGDVAAFRELMDSAYGKVTEKTEISGPDGKPIETHNTTMLVSDQEIIARYLNQQGAKND